MSETYFKRSVCRLCDSRNIETVFELAATPLCDAYVPREQLHLAQETYPLELALCRDCGYVFLPYVVNPEIIYRNYIYVTTSSLGLSQHFQRYAEEVLHYLRPARDSLVVDIGSNDGTLLKYFKEQGMRVLGIEPAINIASNATASAIETIPDFFIVELADKIRRKYGPALIVTMNNLFANIDNLTQVTEGVKRLLAPEGVFVVESSYLADMAQNMVFDFIYHEHLSYFSVKPMDNFFRRFKMKLFNLQRVATKGGSLRYYVQLESGLRPLSSEVGDLIAYEEKLGLNRPEIFKAFANTINDRKIQLTDKLHRIKEKGESIAGYGGSATTTTFLYHFGISSMIDYIADDNPAKQNTFSPGFHIPVLPSQVIYQQRPDYILVIAWRYFDAIVNKHRDYLQQGGSFIRPLPELEVLEGTRA